MSSCSLGKVNIWRENERELITQRMEMQFLVRVEQLVFTSLKLEFRGFFLSAAVLGCMDGCRHVGVWSKASRPLASAAFVSALREREDVHSGLLHVPC